MPKEKVEGLRDDLTSRPTLLLVFRQGDATTRTTRTKGVFLADTISISSQVLSSDPPAHPPAPCGRLSRRSVMPTNLAASRPCRLYSSVKKRNAQAGTPRTGKERTAQFLPSQWETVPVAVVAVGTYGCVRIDSEPWPVRFCCLAIAAAAAAQLVGVLATADGDRGR
ncbi:hypothetical protein BDP55DRAFT_629987 [Colletotrichum godetiae]|uniref:Uncharacterized protein n=1 Tax=Colletotrichum godetiae TaxID=1209918 RepID=A0AAJ0AQA5_9PEZI|nr:uncharacterized protein BDP55DRAFT_629987 [Colletotrichum godetiae]KAK1688398.1 hypothetical protein BDP55DRAFT_629987 [Colletotrichum godetiae]